MSEVLANKEDRIKAASQNWIEDNGKPDKETVYTQNTVDRKATFLHGDEVQFLNRWVYEYIKYPESAIRNGIEGRVIVEFVVDSKGKVGEIEIVKGVNDEIDAQVKKVVLASSKWKPAQIKGR